MKKILIFLLFDFIVRFPVSAQFNNARFVNERSVFCIDKDDQNNLIFIAKQFPHTAIYKTDADNNIVLWKYDLPDTCYSTLIKVFMNEIYIVANYFGATPSVHPTLMKLAPSGSVIFNKKIKEPTAFNILSICVAAQKKIYLGTSSLINYNNLVIALDSTGNFLWSKAYNFTGGYGYITSLNPDVNNNSDIYVSSLSLLSAHRILLQFKINSTGTVLWNRFYQVPFLAGTTVESPISKLDLANNIYGICNLDDSGDLHCYNVAYKMDNAGNLIWSNRYPYPISDGIIGYHFDLSPDKYIYMLNFYNVPALDSIANLIVKINQNDGSVRKVLSDYTLTTDRYTFLRIKSINADKFVLTTDANNCVIAAMDSSGIGLCDLTSINLNPVSFPLNELTLNLTTVNRSFNVIDTTISLAAGGYTMIPYCSTIGINETDPNIGLIYPNPVSDILYIKNNFLKGKNMLEMYNVLGEEVFSENQEARIRNQATVDVSSLPPGVYFVKLFSEQGSVTRKVVIQH